MKKRTHSRQPISHSAERCQLIQGAAFRTAVRCYVKQDEATCSLPTASSGLGCQLCLCIGKLAKTEIS